MSSDFDSSDLSLSFDGDPTQRAAECHECDESHDTSTGFLLSHGSAFAIYFANWYPHQAEAWLDIAMGSWVEPDYADHFTFGCRIGLFGDSSSPVCSLVPAAVVRSDSPMFGVKLSREDALGHPWLPFFWDTVDWLMVHDPTLHEHVFHMGER